MVLDRKELMKKLFHTEKSRQENAPSQDEPMSYQEPSFTNEGRAKTDGQRARRNDQERSRSTLGKSSSKQERSKENRDYDSPKSPKSKKDRSEYVLDKQRRKREQSIVKRDKFSKTKDRSGENGDFVRVALPITNASKLDAILFFFPRFHTCCCCLSLKTGCFIIGWTQVVGCLIVGSLQSFIALVCFEHINPRNFSITSQRRLIPLKQFLNLLMITVPA
uniref:Uncharacterized protein n=1 Tax=Lygus hesperus TaxID=30085 RepID=A0A0A9VSN6_LYGHE